jgi:hypothetical protein
MERALARLCRIEPQNLLDNRVPRRIVAEAELPARRGRHGRKSMKPTVAGLALATGLAAVPALADDTIKIAFIDPLSGGGASVGEVGLKTFQYLADEINAAGGVNGKTIEIVGLDNKANPQESLIQGRRRRIRASGSLPRATAPPLRRRSPTG